MLIVAALGACGGGGGGGGGESGAAAGGGTTTTTTTTTGTTGAPGTAGTTGTTATGGTATAGGTSAAGSRGTDVSGEASLLGTVTGDAVSSTGGAGTVVSGTTTGNSDPATNFGLANPAPIGSQAYQLVLNEDFTGNTLNTDLWTPSTGRRRQATNTTDALTVDDGQLFIQSYTEGGTHFTGFIETTGKFESAYGYYEARILHEPIGGNWCAFWLYTPSISTDFGDPAANGVEVDIAELFADAIDGSDARNYAHLALHWDGYGSRHKTASTLGRLPDNSTLAYTWHVYSVLWTPTQYVFYIDNVEQWRVDYPVSAKAQNIILSCEVQNGVFAGNRPTQGFGSRTENTYGMRVDWVRYWQPKD